MGIDIHAERRHMSILRTTAALLLAVVMLQMQGPAAVMHQAQGPAAATPEAAVAAALASLDQRPTAARLSQILRTLQTNMKVADTAKAEVDKLAAEAATFQNQGNAVEARRRLAHAIAVQRGLPWDAKAEFAGALTLRTQMIVADSSSPFYAQLTQGYAAPYSSASGLRLRVTAADFAAPGKVIKDLGTFEIYARDLTEEPYNFSASMEGLADGPYQLAAELTEGTAVLGRWTMNILTVRDFEAQHNAIEKRLAKIRGFDSTKATIRYPFDYARVINLGRRDLIPGRNPEDNVNNDYFDFSAEIRNSLVLLKSLESGKDPLVRAKGEHARHYAFAEAGEIMPYRVFVPSRYNSKTKLPLVVVLHGSGADQDTYFKRRGTVLTSEAEKHGFIIVTPLGYRPTGGWGRSGSPMGAAPAAAAGRGGAPAAAPGRGAAPAAAPGRGAAPAAAPGRGGGVQMSEAGRARTSELSEKDAFNVIELVANEYGIDRSRMYLMGNSMGGAGTWYLGTKYPERWAAIAPSASPSVGEGFPIEKLKGMAVLYTVGENDNVQRSRDMIQWLKERGLDIPYNEIKNGTHDLSVWQNLPNIFDFFEKHRGK
jgi:poly(3-hydroxybutyrate) depolymerase